MPNLDNSGSQNNGDITAALYGGIRRRQRDRYGEIVDDLPQFHGEAEPAIKVEDTFLRYCQHLESDAEWLNTLPSSRLESLADNARSILIRRRGHS